MKTYEYAGGAIGPRSHPWTGAAGDMTARYLDLRAEPALVRTALEDFAPFASFLAVERFYAMLEWVNGPGSALESSDCAFTPPYPNDHADAPQALVCTGRVMLLFRELARNAAPGELAGLRLALHRALAPVDPTFTLGAIGTTLVPVRYLALGEGGAGVMGAQLLISFWAWGDAEREAMNALGRLMKHLARAVQDVGRAAVG
jgi:hypothetical protein